MKTDNPPQSENASPGPGASKSRTWIRRAGISFVSLTSAVALFYGVENWRGARAWSTTLTELKASGAKLSYADFAGAPVPDDENMIMHPAFRCFTFTQPDGARVRRRSGDKPDEPDNAMAAKWEAMEKDLSTHGDLFASLYDLWTTSAPEISTRRSIVEKLRPVLSSHDELLDAVGEACRRPHARWPQAANPDSPPFLEWQASAMRGWMAVSRMNSVRAFILSSEGKSDKAWSEAVSASRISMITRAGIPTMMTLIFAAAMEGQETAIISRLLEEPVPLPERFSGYERSLAARPALTDSLADAAEGERALGLSLFEWTFREGKEVETYQNLDESYLHPRWVRLAPEGWFRQNAAVSLQVDNGMLTALHSAASPAQRVESLSNYLAEREAAMKGRIYGQLARGKASVYKNIGRSFLKADTNRVLLRTALIAAQHRATTGKTLLSLDELSPELKARVPRGPMHDDLPAISRDEDGVWTLSCLGYGESPRRETNPSLRIRGW